MGETPKKPKGRRSPYIYFIQDYLKQLRKKNNNNFSFEESSKLCAAKWKHLSEDAKKKYRDLAEEDARRYRQEMAGLTPQELKLLKKRKKDPAAPVKPMSAYMWFSKMQWKKVAKKHPDMSFSEIRKELTRLWKKCDTKKRAKYEAMAEYDRKCYHQEKEKYAREKRKKN